MARKQAVKPRNVQKATQQDKAIQHAAATANLVAITTKQSTDIVQTFVHSSISTLAFFRGLLPDVAFDQQFYQTTNEHWTYKDYAAGNGQPCPSVTKGGSRMRVIRRGRSLRADTILDWLEKGAFNALQQKYLRSLHIFIVEDPHEPDNILEAYSFTFQYTDGTASTRTLSGVEVADLRGDTICVKDARFEVNKLSFQLASLCKNMPSLPEQRHMKMVLRHTPDCPKNYVPPGFEASSSTDVEISFPIATGWKKVDAVLKELDFGPHKLQFSAAHLSYSGPENHDSGTGDDTRRIPTNLSYGTPINLFEADGEMDGAEQPNLQTVIERPVENPACSPSPTASDMDLDDVPLVIRKPLLHSGPSSSPVLSAVTDNREAPVVTVGSSAIPRSTNTGSPPGRPEDLLDRERLHRMLQPSVQQTDTQKTQLLGVLSQDAVNQEGFGSVVFRLKLSQTTVDRLEWSRSKLLPPRNPAATLRKQSDLLGIDDVDKVNCQCGSLKGEDDMLYCSFCDTWQHLYCYGYRGTTDPRQPDEHACYQCLLQGKEEERMGKLRFLAGIRHIIHVLETKEMSGEKQLADYLDLDGQTVRHWVQLLRKKRFLLPASGRKKMLTLNKDVSMVQNLTKEFFDPLVEVAHHFKLPLPPNDAGPSTMMAAEDASQYQRYPLRRRKSQVGQDEIMASNVVECSIPPSASKKRARGLEEVGGSSTPKRPLHITMARGFLNLTEPTPPRHSWHRD